MFTIYSTLTEEVKWYSDAQYELESLSKEIKTAVKPILPNT